MQTALIGIDIGGTNIQGAAVVDGKISARGKIATRAGQGPAAVIKDLVELVLKLAAGKKIQAVGLGIPGLLDAERGICISSCNLGWQEVHISRELSRKIDAPVVIDNDARVAALGEWSQGQAKNCSDFICLTIGTGIGAGIVSNGQILRGSRWAAGEAGHMILDPHGPECACGNRGCLEALASGTAIARQGRAAAAANPSSLLAKSNDIDAAVVFAAAQAGDRAAAQVVATAMTWLGLGVANLVNLFNPRLVVIGGGVSLAGEQVVAPVRAQVHRYAMKVQRETVTITTSSLRDAAGVYGALELARRGL
ncbi:MAG TPA: ROK family protein [Bacillota bacterium]|nr:ROK family protein [Bacillota bacterium]